MMHLNVWKGQGHHHTGDSEVTVEIFHHISKVHNTQHYCCRPCYLSHGVPWQHHPRSSPSYPRFLQRGLLVIRHILTDGHPAPKRGRPKCHIPPSASEDSVTHVCTIANPTWDNDAEPTTSLMQRAPLPNYSPPRTTTHGGTRPPGVTCPNLRPQYDPCACVPNSLAITRRDHALQLS
jgi:hypothetical protein